MPKAGVSTTQAFWTVSLRYFALKVSGDSTRVGQLHSSGLDLIQSSALSFGMKGENSTSNFRTRPTKKEQKIADEKGSKIGLCQHLHLALMYITP